MKTLLVLPILVPLLTAASCLLLWKWRLAQRTAGLVGAVALLVSIIALLRAVLKEGVAAVTVGGWPAPFGISLVADIFSALMLTVTGMIAVAVAVYSVGSIDSKREKFGYYALFHVLLMGVCGSFLTGDIFNLYVWFEVMLIASFVLIALGGEWPQVEGALKYVALNLLASAFFLAGTGLLYRVAGTLNMADLAVKLRAQPDSGLPVVLSMLFLTAFGAKAAVFPFFYWLPASYHTPPVAVSALFAGLLTKVGVYALIRVFSLIFVQEQGFTHSLILVISGLTMITGVLGAVAQNDFRRILSFHIISQIGYMVLGLGLFTSLALAGSVFYILHHILVKTNLFLISGLANRLAGSYELKRLGGLYASHPGLAVLFLIPALSLAGLPPLSGFFSKLILVRAGLECGRYELVAVALAVSVLTLFSMTKVWAEAFWKPLPEGIGPLEDSRNGGIVWMWAAACGLALLTLAIGAGAGWLFDVSFRAAEQLADPSEYIRAVLGAAI